MAQLWHEVLAVLVAPTVFLVTVALLKPIGLFTPFADDRHQEALGLDVT